MARATTSPMLSRWLTMIWLGVAAFLCTSSARAGEPAGLTPAEREQADQINKVFSRAAQIAMPGVVQLRATNAAVAEENPGEEPDPIELLGSGCIIDAKGYIITANHVVEKAEKVTVFLADGQRFEAVEKLLDPDTELAMVRIEPGAVKLTAMSWGDSGLAQIGQPVLAIGAPFSLGQTVTSGVISFKGRHNGALGPWGYEDFIQTDTVINKGNSGGPLVNLYGEIIGINSMILNTNGTGIFTGYGFAVPSKLAQFVAQELMQYGKVRRGWLGIKLSRYSLAELRRLDPAAKEAQADEDLLASLVWVGQLKENVEGVLVLKVQRQTPAGRGGMRDRDIIVAVNGQPVATTKQFKQQVAQLPPNSVARMVVWRNGQRVPLEITLGDRDAAKEETTGQ